MGSTACCRSVSESDGKGDEPIPINNDEKVFEAAAITANPEMSLFERIGGKDAVDASVEKFCTNILADTTLSPLFVDLPKDDLHTMQTSFLSMAFGGPNRTTKLAQEGKVVTDTHFDAVAEHIRLTLKELGASDKDKDEAMSIVASVKNDVMVESAQAAALKAQEEEDRKKAEDEEAAAKLEEDRKKKEEEEAAAKAKEEEEKLKKQKAATAAKKKKELEAKKKAEEEAKKKAEEEAKKKAEEESKTHKPVPPPARIASNPTATFHTSEGDIEFELYLEQMPRTVSNFCYLTQNATYSGSHFHRVRADCLQGGCPFSKDLTDRKCGFGKGPPKSKFKNIKTGSSYKRDDEGQIKDEFGEDKSFRCSNVSGTLSIANSGLANSGGSQFFINVKDQTDLDWWHPEQRRKSEKKGQNRGNPVFGNLISGMDVVQKIADLKHEDPMQERGQRPIQIKYVELKGIQLPLPKV